MVVPLIGGRLFMEIFSGKKTKDHAIVDGCSLFWWFIARPGKSHTGKGVVYLPQCVD